MKIEWQFPAFRPGVGGVIDRLAGPGATLAEKRLQFSVPLLAAGALLAYGTVAQLDWSAAQYVVALLLTVDMVGGVITNATSSAKRWFHRAGEGFSQHMGFVGLHFIQLTLFSVLFLSGDWLWVLMTGSYMLMASALVLQSPFYLQRPVALALYALSLVLSLYGFDSAPAMEWFLPLFYLKLLVSHILREEPYRPDHNVQG